jgi:hypothetical protein
LPLPVLGDFRDTGFAWRRPNSPSPSRSGRIRDAVWLSKDHLKNSYITAPTAINHKLPVLQLRCNARSADQPLQLPNLLNRTTVGRCTTLGLRVRPA